MIKKKIRIPNKLGTRIFLCYLRQKNGMLLIT